MTTEEAKKLKRLIAAHVAASIDDSWKGGGDPEDIPYFEKRHKAAKQKLMDEIKRLTKP